MLNITRDIILLYGILRVGDFSLKKIELHLHFDGSIDIDYTNKMLGYDATSELVDTT